MPCKALTNHTSQPSRSGTRRRRCLIRVPHCLAISRMSCAVTPGRILSAGDGMHRHGPSHHNTLEFVASNTRPDRVVSSASSAPAVDARRRTSARRARSGPFLRGAVLGSDSSQAHSRTAVPCGGAGRILKRSSARGRADSSTRGNQRPCRGNSRTTACQNACSCSLGMWATSMHPRKKRCLCRSSPRTRPSETSQESAMSSWSSSRAQGARLRPSPQAKTRPALLDRRTVEDTVEQPLQEHRVDAVRVTVRRAVPERGVVLSSRPSARFTLRPAALLAPRGPVRTGAHVRIGKRFRVRAYTRRGPPSPQSISLSRYHHAVRPSELAACPSCDLTLREFGLPWIVKRLGCREDYRFLSAPPSETGDGARGLPSTCGKDHNSNPEGRGPLALGQDADRQERGRPRITHGS